MMRDRGLAVAALFLTILLSSCSATAFRVGDDFDVQAVAARIERGTTTQAEVQTWLGRPTATGMRVEADGERLSEWTYYYASGNLADAAHTRLKTLQLKFDGNGVVRSFNWTESER
jgi:outer membrane protein assembly factor BamE (lipoprotein component of BamABCDE complex)